MATLRSLKKQINKVNNCSFTCSCSCRNSQIEEKYVTDLILSNIWLIETKYKVKLEELEATLMKIKQNYFKQIEGKIKTAFNKEEILKETDGLTLKESQIIIDLKEVQLMKSICRIVDNLEQVELDREKVMREQRRVNRKLTTLRKCLSILSRLNDELLAKDEMVEQLEQLKLVKEQMDQIELQVNNTESFVNVKNQERLSTTTQYYPPGTCNSKDHISDASTVATLSDDASSITSIDQFPSTLSDESFESLSDPSEESSQDLLTSSNSEAPTSAGVSRDHSSLILISRPSQGSSKNSLDSFPTKLPRPVSPCVDQGVMSVSDLVRNSSSKKLVAKTDCLENKVS